MTSSSNLEIAIVGAGIAGLTAAIALQHHSNIDVQIYERAEKLQEIGASIALGPNGMRTLDKLGVHNALDDSIAFRNKSRSPMIYRHYKTNEVVSVDEHQGLVEDCHLTSRFYRPHLQQALAVHVNPSRIHLKKSFGSANFDHSLNKLVIAFEDGTTATADILLGTDGIHSPVRRFFVPTSIPNWTGWVTFRSVFPISHVSRIPDLPDEACHFWGPNRTLFVSKLGKDLFTIVGSYQADPDAPDAPWKDSVWNEQGDVEVLREYYQDWSPLARALIDATPYTRIYPNAAAPGLDSWVFENGRVTLAGDAAHAHGGAFAAGGSLAIDDAWAFAASILHVFPEGAVGLPSDEDIALALRSYENTRKGHTDRVLKTVLEGNKKKKAMVGKPETDEELRVRMKNRPDTAWIHECDVEAAFKKVLSQELQNGNAEEQARL
ncbi:uncharacterized protein BCR38DRAFT_461454 [Pseudomassariella vexata]|uniref:FAD-binding domain-containing protein n=1 Tax=Pseudomassariella vexata TaxID=1141098 RepID=A0A1Y2DC68_9PEZI|nr:uncharacterized protein BCR38DRAFT_461454 [Pseudomassariella vexata]ORY56849.1 hypothetical protein BCR38DRAFT_461454 [Pseudomassariella vexata]